MSIKWLDIDGHATDQITAFANELWDLARERNINPSWLWSALVHDLIRLIDQCIPEEQRDEAIRETKNALDMLWESRKREQQN